MVQAIFKRRILAKTLVRIAITVASLNSIAIAHSASPYQAPAYNYNQNNWMAN